MKTIEYSPIVTGKLKRLRKFITEEYNDSLSEKILKEMLDDVDNLALFEESGVNISKRYDLETDYWYLFTHQHYFIYRIETTNIIIVQLFHEKEDFMKQLFGISGRSQESIDYWGE